MGTRQLKGYLDLVLFGGFLLAFYVSQTGVSLHQWIGLGFTGLAGLHLAWHWPWVTSACRRFGKPAARKTRKFVVVDALLGLSGLVVFVSGLVISTWFNLDLPGYGYWRLAHVGAAVLSLALVLLKVALHERWITAFFRRLLRLPPAPVLTPAPRTRLVSRREFFALMGVATPLVVITGVRSTDDLVVVARVLAASSQPCSAQNCPRKCHFPGKCSRYRDKDGNQRCDLGECA